MKHIHLLFAVAAMLFVASCKEGAELPEGDFSRYDLPTGTSLYLQDANGNRNFTQTDFRTNGSTNLTLVSSNNEGSASVDYDLAALAQYNAENGTTYEALPANLVEIANGGAVYANQSIAISYKTDASLDPAKTYAIPLRLNPADDCTVADRDKYRLILLRDLTNIPDCHKTTSDGKPAVKIFSLMEINDCNPLNHLCFTLKKSGKYLFDAVVLFAANINYNAERGLPYIYCNENIKAVLDNRDKYLKPLQDAGMKVILGLLCNHDHTSLANLEEATAKEFAKEIKAVCDAYNLDGVLYDCEYCNPASGHKGFTSTNSGLQASRLMYEVKKVQPERWNVDYLLASFAALSPIDGKQPSEYCDYALEDYTQIYGNSVPGLDNSRWGVLSQEFAQGIFRTDVLQLKSKYQQGYGAHSIFAFDPYRANYESGQLPALKACAKAFYDDDLLVSPDFYKQDWK